jgi:hypothetical protein
MLGQQVHQLGAHHAGRQQRFQRCGHPPQPGPARHRAELLAQQFRDLQAHQPGQHDAQVPGKVEAVGEELGQQRPQRAPAGHHGRQAQRCGQPAGDFGTRVQTDAVARQHQRPQHRTQGQRRQGRAACGQGLFRGQALAGQAQAQLARADLQRGPLGGQVQACTLGEPLAVDAHAVGGVQHLQAQAAFGQGFDAGVMGGHERVVQHDVVVHRAAQRQRPMPDVEHTRRPAFALEALDQREPVFGAVHAKPSR